MEMSLKMNILAGKLEYPKIRIWIWTDHSLNILDIWEDWIARGTEIFREPGWHYYLTNWSQTKHENRTHRMILEHITDNETDNEKETENEDEET